MEEDVLGTREEGLGDLYTTCSRCGRVFPRSEAKLVEDEVIEETRSEQEVLCPDCRKQIQMGEDLPAA